MGISLPPHGMVPSSPDLVAWLANELSLTYLRANRDGTVTVIAGNAAEPDATLEDHLAAVTGAEPAWLAEIVEEVGASGAPAALELPSAGPESESSRLLVWRDGEELAVLYAARVSPAHLARRAAAADFAAGVTHEVANSLTAIAGWTKMAATSAPLPERTRQALEVVQRSAREALDTARGLLRTMRDSSHGTIAPSLPDRTDSGAVIREVLETLRPELEAHGVTLQVALPDGIYGAAPPAALRLIVSNLVRNAFEAMEDGGRIGVSVEADDEQFVLVVDDDGPGMSRETLERAFERYFTTKDAGTGLGLAMVRDTVHEAGGRVEVTSQRGRGTRFEVALPLAGAARLSLRPPRVIDGGPNSSGVHARPVFAGRAVLVVDDDEAIRALVRTALELQGARVEVAADPVAATELAARRDFDVALVDLALGSERGDRLVEELLALGRVDHVVLMTGLVDAEPSEHADALLRKPFELPELQRVVEEVCASPGSGAGEASSS